MTEDEAVDVFWHCLKRDPEHEDRRQTAWGTKTRKGLVAVLRRIGDELVKKQETDND